MNVDVYPDVIIWINLAHVKCVLHAAQSNFLYIFQVIFNTAPYLGLSQYISY